MPQWLRFRLIEEMEKKMEKKMGELVTVETETGVQTLNLGMLQGATPGEMLKAAAAIAEPLNEFIEKRGLFQKFGDKKHVEATGWSTMLVMLGVCAQEISITEVPVDIEGYGSKYIAKMALVRISDQQPICSASAECGGVDERDWHFKNKYEWPGGQRTLVGEVPVPGNTRRSMAITRAVGKAARVGFSWIIELAGYSPTPAEEMGDDSENINPDPSARHNPNTGRDPREMMDKNSKPANSQRNTGVKRLSAKFQSTCKLCSNDILVGSEIAYKKDENGNAHVAHYDCYLDTQNAEGGK